MEIYKNRRMLTGAALLCTFALTLSVFPVHATDSIESLESQTSALEKELAGINQDILDLSNQISDTEMQIEILNSSIDKTQDDLLDAEEKENRRHVDVLEDFGYARLDRLLHVADAAFAVVDDFGQNPHESQRHHHAHVGRQFGEALEHRHEQQTYDAHNKDE